MGPPPVVGRRTRHSPDQVSRPSWLQAVPLSNPTAFRNVLVAIDFGGFEGRPPGSDWTDGTRSRATDGGAYGQCRRSGRRLQSWAGGGCRSTGPRSWKTRGNTWKRSCRSSRGRRQARAGVHRDRSSSHSRTRRRLRTPIPWSSDGAEASRLLGFTALRVLRKNDRALLVIPRRPKCTEHVERQRAA